MGSLSKNEIKLIRSLHRKKERLQHQAFLIEGEKLIEEALQEGVEISLLALREDSRLNGRFLGARIVSASEMQQVSALASGSPALAVAKIPEVTEESGAWNRILAIDGLSDPGNLGTIIRTADWFGIKELWLSKETVDVYYPKTVQATMGSLFRVRTSYVDLPATLEAKKAAGYSICVTTLGAKSLDALKGEEPKVVVIGSEAHGVSEAVLQLASEQLTIPRHGDVESLNAATATAIVLYEWTR